MRKLTDFIQGDSKEVQLDERFISIVLLVLYIMYVIWTLALKNVVFHAT